MSAGFLLLAALAVVADSLRPRERTVPLAGRAPAGVMLALALLVTRPPSVSAQEVMKPGTVEVVPVSLLHASDEDRAAAFARRMTLVRRSLENGMLATSYDDSLATFSLAVDTAFVLILMAPDDPDAHYIYAAALGQRLELAGTREKIRLGAATRSAAEAALALDPDHAGAHHVLGRINAATMRMSFVARFVARRLLGAKALDGASWEQAENHFARARDLEPGNPRYSMELGVLYADTGRPAEALAALKQAIAAPRTEASDSLAIHRAIQVMASLDCGSCSR